MRCVLQCRRQTKAATRFPVWSESMRGRASRDGSLSRQKAGHNRWNYAEMSKRPAALPLRRKPVPGGPAGPRFVHPSRRSDDETVFPSMATSPRHAPCARSTGPPHRADAARLSGARAGAPSCGWNPSRTRNSNASVTRQVHGRAGAAAGFPGHAEGADSRWTSDVSRANTHFSSIADKFRSESLAEDAEHGLLDAGLAGMLHPHGFGAAEVEVKAR